MEGGIQLITDELMGSVLEQAKRSPRRRMNHNFHSGPEDNPHRFLNVLTEGTYVAPHRHLNPPKAESFVVLEGLLAVICFEDDGKIRDRFVIGTGAADLPKDFRDLPVARGIDIQPGIWHTIAALTPSVVCFEVKPGPWKPSTDKEFAPWAPQEGDPGAAAYLNALLA